MGMEGPPPDRKLATSAGRLNPHPFIVAQFNIARASLARVTARMLTLSNMKQRYNRAATGK
jgi:hypothetical protein